MSMHDPIADMLTRIRNAQAAQKVSVTMPSSKVKNAIADVLQSEGYIADFSNHKNGFKTELTITLKYFEGRPVIEKIDRVSRPSLRVYKGKDNLPKVLGGLGISIVSTSKGLMSSQKAQSVGLGGELICNVS
ncbi:30S ribosomal subunit protein S8 [Gammaproteobacteria bacterium]|nr:30S ribosomal subunit protein S8 [Gammaproteobacteria bacterium]